MKKFIIIFLLLFASKIAYTQAVVYIDPATYYKSVGDTALVVFKISNVTDLHSSSVLVKFNNTVVKYLGAVNGTFYPGGSFFGQQPSVSFVKDSVFIDQAIMGQSSISGSGTLFTLKFKALANGVSPVTIKNVELRTLANNEINYSSQNGLILIGGITANLKVFLQGPFNTTTNLMNTSLNTAGYIPLNQPYNVAPWNYTGTESVASGFFGLNTTVVDWVLVELRTGTGGTTTVSKKAGLLKSNGSIVDYRDPNTPIIFEGVASGNYYVVIRHRNHLGVMTSSTVSLSQSPALYDF
ncbi:MAG: cohesin domain-containing protein, partial [Ignavibacteria bacterium]|nr:cohesin domain-containing protein [Ignavibacteria bacterium]